MHNYLFLKRTKELEELGKELGFTKTFFIEDFLIIKGNSKKEVLKQIKNSKDKLTVYRAPTEDLLRFALEKTPVSIVMGMEKINPRDSVHFLRGGLDQIICKIAKDKNKTIAFSFSDILNSKQRSKLLARMMFNLKICKKYKVNAVFSNFSLKKEEMRSAKDLQTFQRVLS